MRSLGYLTSMVDEIRKMLKTEEGAAVQQSFYRHVLKSWGEHGLGFHEHYPK